MKILTARYLLPITSTPLEDGALVISEGRIHDFGPREKILSQYPDVDVEDLGQSILMPGLVNAHAHLDLLLFDGKSASGEQLEFFDWLIASWNHRRKLNPSDRRYCLDEGVRQLLASGTTCVGDVGQYVGVIAQAMNSAMRMVLFPEILTGGEANIMELYESAFSQVDEILATGSLKIGAGIAPYAAYTLSRHLLKILTEQARELRVPVKIHVAETFAEMQFFYESKGEIADKLFPQMGWSGPGQLPPEHRLTPIRYLDSIGFLDNAPTLIGCNHLADPDLEILVKRKVKIVHSPRMNHTLKLGNPPLKKLRDLKIPIGLGTDAIGTLHTLSIWDEMRYIQDHYPENEKVTSDDLLTMATLGGAHALGLADRIGSLEKGKEADLIAIHSQKDIPLEQLSSWLITNATDRNITSVFVEGKPLKV